MPFDRENFELFVGEHHIQMVDGVLLLSINGARHLHYDRYGSSYTMAVTIAAVLHVATTQSTSQILGALIEEAIGKGATD